MVLLSTSATVLGTAAATEMSSRKMLTIFMLYSTGPESENMRRHVAVLSRSGDRCCSKFDSLPTCVCRPEMNNNGINDAYQ